MTDDEYDNGPYEFDPWVADRFLDSGYDPAAYNPDALLDEYYRDTSAVSRVLVTILMYRYDRCIAHLRALQSVVRDGNLTEAQNMVARIPAEKLRLVGGTGAVPFGLDLAGDLMYAKFRFDRAERRAAEQRAAGGT